MNIADGPTDSTELYDWDLEHVWPNATDRSFERMAIPQRNAILDDLRRREENLERRAEERRNGTWAIPAHVREDLL